MVEIEIVQSRLDAMNEYVTQLTVQRNLSVEQMLADQITYSAIQRWLQLASQAAIDVASHILSADFAKQKHNYREMLLALGSEGVLPAEFAQRFAGIAGFRNVLVHMYLEVDPNKVHEMLHEHLDDFRSFFEYIVDYLKKTGALDET